MNRTVAAVIITLGFPAVAAAQPPDWTQKLQLGKPVFITTESGERVEGVAGQITPEAVVVSTPSGIRTVPYRELRRVQKRDALWTGAATGAVTGAAFGIAVIADADCSYGGNQCETELTGFVVGSALYGALIGWGLDALVKGKTTVFQSKPRTTMTVAPRRGGLSAAIAFNW
jgi:hypothetical protein